ncbi:hypothetical protein GFJ99_11770 [Flavobacterium sp. LMO6]|uniref:Uncharacterized protein n=1 Tax=Flavobacterium phage vB_FspS_laban6-1 TaxID=2686250 RepID=A0A6B9LN13_9CAUD|nr:hypothetical protein [Flavobacterium sp. LMO6]YP_009854846.1 hypothetical protein HWC90_gp48 [Flavobacterium phage vB_FspS_laban6-1]MQP63373.1 hypothetical protein [Flavobacterium sp. LMO6]QHB39019.1 hypothetical protein laban61_gp048 [Flavobacterium phage vB_FspS_laban6-1]
MENPKFQPDIVSENYIEKCTDKQKIELLEHDIKNLEDMIHHYSKKSVHSNQMKHLAFMNSLAERIKLKQSQIKKMKK